MSMTPKIIVTEACYKTQLVGYLEGETKVVIYPGAIRHIKRRHRYAFKKYFTKLPMIIDAPDYRGNKNGESIELIKKYKDYVLVALKYNEKEELFVSSMYIIEAYRIEKRLEQGKMTKVVQRNESQKQRKQSYKNRK